jgi:hypothetical protein
MKKAALVMAHKDEWPSIESDLAEASSNGLAAAKAGARDWHESLALDWARARGKLRKTGAGSGLQQAMHNMSNLPGRTHKLSG